MTRLELSSAEGLRQAPRVLCLLLIATGIVACSGEGPEQQGGWGDQGPSAVSTVKPALASLDDVFLEREATLLPVATARISTRQEGFVRNVAPEVGDLVHKGDLIAEIDAGDLQLELMENEASLAKARATLSEHQRGMKRTKKLYAGKIISEGQRDDDRAELDRARADVDEARARVERARQNLTEVRIHAPDAGAITQLFTEDGEFVERGDDIAEIKVIRAMVALCTVGEKYLADVKEGASVYVDVAAYPGRRFQGLVWKIVPDAVVESRAFPIKVLLPNPDHALKPGMSARISFVRRIDDGLLVPKDAVLDADTDAHALVVRNGAAERRDLELGSALGDSWHVRAGLEPTDDVVISGNEDLAEGDEVKIVTLPPPGPPTLPGATASDGAGTAGL
jgi:membrane fusion protein (multidrug efflux system)